MMNALLTCPECGETAQGFNLYVENVTDVNPDVIIECKACGHIAGKVPLCCIKEYDYDETSDRR